MKYIVYTMRYTNTIREASKFFQFTACFMPDYGIHYERHANLYFI